MSDVVIHIDPSAVETAETAPVRPFDRATVTMTKTEHIQLICDRNRWQSLALAKQARIEELEKQNAVLAAEIRELKQRMYGRKTENRNRPESTGAADTSGAPPRKRGHQPGAPGHGRTPRKNLPVVEEQAEPTDGQRICPDCGLPAVPAGFGEASGIIEIKVQSYVRRVVRNYYRPACGCQKLPALIAAPPPPRLLPRCALGNSVWIEVMLDKFLRQIPLSRSLARLAEHGLDAAQGTVTGGLRRLLPLFEPLMAELVAVQMADRLLRADETRWMVFVSIEGKQTHKWQLWVVHSASAVVYRIFPGRGADALRPFFEALKAAGGLPVVLVVDRYSVYKCLAKEYPFVVLAFCWAHVRRDFFKPAQVPGPAQAWFQAWVDKIGALYSLNRRRLEHWDGAAPLSRQSPAFARCHAELCWSLGQMAEDRCRMLRDDNLDPAQRSALESMKNHWDGLTVFRDRPEVPMDNNQSERDLRSGAVGRKNYYGSGSEWSARLTAALMSVFQTLLLWGIEPRRWLAGWLDACAAAGGRLPADLRPFLPWEMDADRTEALSRPAPSAEKVPREQAGPL